MNCKVGRFLLCSWTLVIVLVLLFPLTGCNSSSKKYDAGTGKKTEVVSQDDAVTRNLAEMLEQCRETEAKATKETTLEEAVVETDCTNLTGARAQEICVSGQFNQSTLMILGIALRQSMQANQKYKPTCAEQVSAIAVAYFGKESDQAKAWGSAGLAAAIAVPTAWVIGQGIKMVDNLGSNSGDKITTGPINMQKSDDPVGGGGGGGGDVAGSQVLNIGSGSTATDRAMLNQNVDKAIAVPLDGDSNFDEVSSGSQGGIIIDDPDGQNSGSFF